MNDAEQQKKISIADIKGAGSYVLSALFWIAIWYAIALLIGNDLLLADPIQTLEAIGECLMRGSFWNAVAGTSLKVIATSTASATLALILGAIGYRHPFIHKLCAPILQIMKSAPVACVVVIVLVAWGTTGAFIVIVAFVAFPPFYIAMQQSLKERDRQTEKVLELFGLDRRKIFCAYIWGEALPFFIAASKTAIALSWRAGVTAELLSLPMGTIGAGVYASKLTLDSAELLVWTITVMLLSWLNEKLVVGALRLTARVDRLAIGKREAGGDRRDVTEDIEAPSILELVDVTKSYNGNEGKPVLDGLSLQVLPGQRLCLMAPTGSGKSTTLGLLSSLRKPDSGKAISPDTIGIVMQEPTLIPNLTAFQNVALCAAHHTTDERINEILNRLLPPDCSDQRTSELSGGTKRLVEIVRAMLSDGRAIILDEPFAGLDPERRKEACAFILESLKERPLVIATHDPVDADLLNAGIIELMSKRTQLSDPR